MLSLKGIYNNGEIRFKEKVSISRQVPVIITFLEAIEAEEPQVLNFNNFSFTRSREVLKDYKGTLSDAVIEERRSYI